MADEEEDEEEEQQPTKKNRKIVIDESIAEDNEEEEDGVELVTVKEDAKADSKDSPTKRDRCELTPPPELPTFFSQQKPRTSLL